MKPLLRLRYWRRARRYAHAREHHEITRFIAAIRKEVIPVSRYSHADPFELVRTRGGSVIHDAVCAWGRTGKPWLWAADKHVDELRATVAYFGYSTCAHCAPLAR